MRILPHLDDFTAQYEAGNPQALYMRLVSDLDTPVSLKLKLCDGEPYDFLLESVEGGAVRGRYSMIGLKPDLIWRCFGKMAEINTSALTNISGPFHVQENEPLTSLREVLDISRIDLPENLPPMAAGLFGYMGYDMVRLMENLPNSTTDSLLLPDGLFIRPTLMAIFDSLNDEIILVTPIYPNANINAKAAYHAGEMRLQEALEKIEKPVPHDKTYSDLPSQIELKPTSNMDGEQYCENVKKGKEYIAAGDIFQVVLSQRFETDFPLDAFDLYRSLRRVNPAPFLYYLNFDDFQLIGSSPEILVRVQEGDLTIRPIAGTRPRGKTAAQDRALGVELLNDEKELAEHLMLLDLGRNDAGRVCKVGSIEVTDKFILEHYSRVMHIVSNVEGKLDSEKYDSIDALCAGFPAGTVSGAPKIRAMEIIDELETEKRGPYAGCVGYFSADGNMDTCIVLRTALVKDNKMYVQAGAGIVADSVPINEHKECQAKAEALFRAAEDAVRIAASRVEKTQKEG